MHTTKNNNLILQKNLDGCPYLLLAPMEGVGDRSFRKTLSWIGGFDEAVTEFLSVPANAHVESLAKAYDPQELPIPLAPQIMGADPLLMAAMAQALQKRGAHRIDINCGCPSNTVTGRGAGSSLLKDPTALYELARAVVNAVDVPVSLKMRSGYQDLSLFQDNLLAAQESGIAFLTLHPRTKADGYTPPARWDLIQEAKNLLKIPIVGNGDVTSVSTALSLLSQTGCDALMIGRGALTDPFLFQHIKAHFAKTPYTPSPDDLRTYVETFLSQLPLQLQEKTRIGKLKQLLSFLFRYNPTLLAQQSSLLRTQPSTANELLETALPILLRGFFEKKHKPLVKNTASE